MKNACEGVLYPQNAASCIEIKPASEQPLAQQTPYFVPLKGTTSNLEGVLVPHKGWTYCKEELENIFSWITNNPKESNTIFVLAPLHKGPILIDEKENNKIYCPQDGVLKGSDWEICLNTPEEIKALVEQNDDVCTEEHSLEVIAPFIYKIMPNAQVCYLLATGQAEEICKITSIIGRFYSNSIILLSSNEETNCAYMWKRLEG